LILDFRFRILDLLYRCALSVFNFVAENLVLPPVRKLESVFRFRIADFELRICCIAVLYLFLLK